MSKKEALIYKDGLIRYKLMEVLMTEDNPLLAEYKLLNFFRENWNPNPKKTVQLMARYLRENPNQPDHVVNGLITPILTVRDPVQYLRECFDYQLEYHRIVIEMHENGFHGFITTGLLCYGVRVESDEELTPDNTWEEDEERAIQRELIYEWGKTHQMVGGMAKILLFREYGFSGITRAFEKRDLNDYVKTKRGK